MCCRYWQISFNKIVCIVVQLDYIPISVHIVIYYVCLDIAIIRPAHTTYVFWTIVRYAIFVIIDPVAWSLDKIEVQKLPIYSSVESLRILSKVSTKIEIVRQRMAFILYK